VREIWPEGEAPAWVSFIIKSVRLMGSSAVSESLRLAWSESRELQFALGEDAVV
jgi:hypothetical protein